MTDLEKRIEELTSQIEWLDMAAMDARLAGEADSAGIIAWASARLVDNIMKALAGDARTKADQK